MILLTVKVSALAGSRIEETAQAMLELANRMGVYVECDFNEVTLCIRPGGSPENLMSEYHYNVGTRRTCKLAFG